MKVIRKKRKLWKTYSNTKEFPDYLAYKQVEKTVKNSVKNAKKTLKKNLLKT